MCIFFGNAVAGITGSLSHTLQGLTGSSHGIEAETIPDATNTDAYHKPAFTALYFSLGPTVIQ